MNIIYSPIVKQNNMVKTMTQAVKTYSAKSQRNRILILPLLSKAIFICNTCCERNIDITLIHHLLGHSTRGEQGKTKILMSRARRE